jgi:hypothetical protein
MKVLGTWMFFEGSELFGWLGVGGV